MKDWTRRVRPPAGPQELQQIRDAANELARQAGRAPGKAKIVFQTVADYALIGSVVISGALASVHLFKALFSQHPTQHPASGPDDNRDLAQRNLHPHQRSISR